MTTEVKKEYTTEELESMLEQRKEAERLAILEKRKAYESIKETTVSNLAVQAIKMHDALSSFKAIAFEDMGSLYDLLQDHSSRHRDGKGNFSVENADQTFRISYRNLNLGFFDERANQAEKHIIDFVNKHFANDAGTRKLITTLLERTKGKLDIKLVQKLYSMENDYKDDNWKKGIELLKESWQSSGSKSYINFESKRPDGSWAPIVLSLSGV